MFDLVSDFKPAGDQPKAIQQLTDRLNEGDQSQILLGVTGSGKTFTVANVIANVNRPTLILAHNKTLAAQLCAEFREFFPNNSVEYFISYYDYYQPEAYVASRDLYIEKEAQVNDEIERLRHRATRSLLTRRDVIIVASVSCIYGLGTPEDYKQGVVKLKCGQTLSRRKFLEGLEKVQYERNDIEFKRGRYRVRGDVVDVFPSWEEHLVRVEFFGDEIERIMAIHPITGEILKVYEEFDVYPATHYVVQEGIGEAIEAIREEGETRVKELTDAGQVVEADRLEKRTKYDLEMMRELGYCKGIENYSRHLSGKAAGEAPGVLIDFFPDDFLLVVDESHVSIPQVKGMYKGDQARKGALVDHGFRLPSALDNRPLQFSEFEEKVPQCIYVSATPGPYEMEKIGLDVTPNPDGTQVKISKILKDAERDGKDESKLADQGLVQQIIRPTGLVDPEILIKPTKGQIDDILIQVNERIERGERVLITTLTKLMSEDLTDFLEEKGVKVRYLHSDIVTLERVDILHDLRLGKFDVLVGVNLLREGLDLPEVSLVVILDADKEGFLRNERSLIQTMGRAARNINGKVVMYADKVTDSMKGAMGETNRRRAIQLAHNKANNIQPQTIIKKIRDIRSDEREAIKRLTKDSETKVEPDQLPKLLASLEKQMKEASKNLEFEVAAVIRDRIEELKSDDTTLVS
ncbi:excinuclease ABC subunit UvrB [bacterium]|jgi:excinuclease ABC subunit B|nr:excinuclease ABC subunit UvrB [bacterium]